MPEALEEGEEVELDEEKELQKGLDFVYAARVGDIDTVRQLLADENPVPVGFRDSRVNEEGQPIGSNWTALKWAASEGHDEVLALLLENGAAADEEAEQQQARDADELGRGGGSALHWASYKGHEHLVWRLLTCKPKLSARVLDAEGNTPVHLAAAGGHLGIIKTLLSDGVDVSLKNAYGNNAVALSTSAECQALLKEAAAAALDGRPYLCSCSGKFVSEEGSHAAEVIDRVSAPNVRPVRYSNDMSAMISNAEVRRATCSSTRDGAAAMRHQRAHAATPRACARRATSVCVCRRPD